MSKKNDKVISPEEEDTPVSRQMNGIRNRLQLVERQMRLMMKHTHVNDSMPVVSMFQAECDTPSRFDGVR